MPVATAGLGRTGLRVTRLALGTAPLGNLFTPVAEEDAAATVRSALDAGLTYLDTAAPLPPGGTADPEGYVDTPPARRVWDLSGDRVRRSLEESLERLGLDRVDIALVHDPDDHEREARELAFPALAELRDQGLVRAIGAGMNQAGMLTRFVRDLDLDVVLVAGRYSLLDQRALEELLPTCATRGTAVVIGGVFNSGLLADPRPRATFDYAPARPELVERALRLAEVCARHDTPLRAAAGPRRPLGRPGRRRPAPRTRPHPRGPPVSRADIGLCWLRSRHPGAVPRKELT